MAGEKAGQAQKTVQGMKDTTLAKASQAATKDTKRMGTSAMDASKGVDPVSRYVMESTLKMGQMNLEATVRTGRYLLEANKGVGTSHKAATQSVVDAVKNPSGPGKGEQKHAVKRPSVDNYKGEQSRYIMESTLKAAQMNLEATVRTGRHILEANKGVGTSHKSVMNAVKNPSGPGKGEQKHAVKIPSGHKGEQKHAVKIPSGHKGEQKK